jgi:hypothetical protein
MDELLHTVAPLPFDDALKSLLAIVKQAAHPIHRPETIDTLLQSDSLYAATPVALFALCVTHAPSTAHSSHSLVQLPHAPNHTHQLLELWRRLMADGDVLWMQQMPPSTRASDGI